MSWGGGGRVENGEQAASCVHKCKLKAQLKDGRSASWKMARAALKGEFQWVVWEES